MNHNLSPEVGFGHIEQEKSPKKYLNIATDMQGSTPEELEILAEKLQEGDPDNIIILGDIFQSRSVEELGEKIKRRKIKISELSPEQKEVYDNFIQDGYPRIRSIMRSLFDTDPEFKEKDSAEIRSQAEAFIKALAASGKKVHINLGNVEVGYPWRVDIIRSVAKEFPNVFLHNQPELCLQNPDTDGKAKEAFVFWPSIDPRHTTEEDLKLKTSEIEKQIKNAGAKDVLVFAHEYIFRGPDPLVYEQSLKDKGLQDKTHINPWYMPNPTRDYVYELLRRLYSLGCEAKLIYGHIEDQPDITSKTLPYLKMDKQGVSPFRIGIAAEEKRSELSQSVIDENERRETKIATIKSIQVPKGKIGSFAREKDELTYHLE